MNMVLRARAFPVVARQMALGLKRCESAANRPLPLARAMSNGLDRWPALATVIIRLIGEREQHQLFAGREVNLPAYGHELYAHAGFSSRALA